MGLPEWIEGRVAQSVDGRTWRAEIVIDEKRTTEEDVGVIVRRTKAQLFQRVSDLAVKYDISMDSNANGVRLETENGSAYLTDPSLRQ